MWFICFVAAFLNLAQAKTGTKAPLAGGNIKKEGEDVFQRATLG